VGVARQYLIRLEAGMNEPTLGLALKLARQLDVTLNDLVK
jgi:DNA-binding XRE family transcriptional regulator